MNSYDKFMENEWNEYVSNNSARISDMMVETEELENEFISHAQERKNTPVYSGVMKYFPDAINAVARCSFAGQQQHAPDEPLQWHRGKSGDELDALARHLLQAGTMDTDGISHSAKVCWRALGNLQKELELKGEAPLSKYNKK
jgi:hypothetical protein